MIGAFQRAIHRHRSWIFWILLGIIIVSFVLSDYAGSGGFFRKGASHQSGPQLNGQPVPPREFEAAKRRYRFNYLLRTGQPIRSGSAINEMLEEAVLQQMAMLKKAEEMGVQASDEEVSEDLKKLMEQLRPMLFKDTANMGEAYDRFIKEVLGPQGMTESDFATMLMDDVVLRKLVGLVSSTAKTTPGEIQAEANELSEKVSARVIRFDFTEYLKGVKPSAEELRKYYEENASRFQTPDRVDVDFVEFKVDSSKVQVTDQEIKTDFEGNKESFKTADGKPQTLKEATPMIRKQLANIKADQEMSRLATEFTLKLVPEEGKPAPEFEKVAGQLGIKVQRSGYFARNEMVKGVSSPRFTAAAFRLTAENPVSDPVAGEGVYHVLHLKGLPQRGSVPPLEQIQEAVKSACSTDMARKQARDAGEKKRQELIAAMEKGKNLEQALKDSKATVQSLPLSSVMDEPPKDAFLAEAQRTAFSIPQGGISEFMPNSTGGYLVGVISRVPGKPLDVQQMQTRVEARLREIQSRQILQDFQGQVMETVLDQNSSKGSKIRTGNLPRK